MLNQLSISQFAIIDQTEINFSAGFTVLSGETGAGKSILIDALSLLLGQRADAGLIRHGAEKADITGIFSQLPDDLIALLDEQELLDEDNPQELVLRKIIRDKGSKTFINGQASTTNSLKSIARYLLNIHGQHANQALLDKFHQRQRLDSYAKHLHLLTDVQNNFDQWQALKKDFIRLKDDQEKQTEKLALLEFQLQAFDSIKPQKDEFATLYEQQKYLAAAEDILQKCHQLNQLLKESESSISTQVYQAQRISEQLSEHSQFTEINDLISQAAIYINEAESSLSQKMNDIELDPQQLQSVNERLTALHDLAIKHHIDTDALADKHQELTQQYAALSDPENNLVDLQAKIENAEKKYLESAQILSQSRKKSAKILSRDIQDWIQQLGMNHAKFRIAITPHPASRDGLDSIEFLLSANPGQNLQPINKVASGGELSRISLAIEVASLSENGIPQTLIFDEIDAGIGGEVAHTIGKLLAQLGENRQVLCITHLPQVAAWGNSHFYIEKTTSRDSTQTKIIALKPQQRISEIARMLGDSQSKTSKEHAAAMIEQCQLQK